MTEVRTNGPVKPSLSLLYGGIAGCVAKTAIAPFDRVKIHFQSAHPELHEFRGRMSGVFGAVHRIYKNSGVRGLFRGHSVTLVRIFPYAAINFAAFEQFKRLLSTGLRTEPHAWNKLLAGSLAGSVAVTVTYPFDIIRARVAYQIASTPKGPTASRTGTISTVIAQLLREGQHYPNRIGLGGFYQGFVPTLLGIVPYAGVSFFTFESSKQFLSRRYNTRHLSSGQIFVAGLLAGALGQTAAYPFDVVRRRMQLFRITDHLPAQHYMTGVTNALRSILQTHGMARGIFAGLSINYIKVAPASGISFLVYERLKQRFPAGFWNKEKT